ncbi:DNA alkylation repair enzyme [Clavibacter michiganensis subsp. michiganensis]|nr:DNA alkylation repair enzyme [Clavibacter michiganensis subsp. michiganensis]
MTRDEAVALASELWRSRVYEERLAAVVLLQEHVDRLDNGDLTRIEGFVRDARLRALVDPLALDVVGPLVERLAGAARTRADQALDRWAGEGTCGSAGPPCWRRRDRSGPAAATGTGSSVAPAPRRRLLAAARRGARGGRGGAGGRARDAA